MIVLFIISLIMNGITIALLRRLSINHHEQEEAINNVFHTKSQEFYSKEDFYIEILNSFINEEFMERIKIKAEEIEKGN